MVRLVFAALVLGEVALGGKAEVIEDFRSQVEADWLRQDRVRTLGPSRARRKRSRVTTAQDALGAVDGVKNGKWGFHTASERNPWWQVDLGAIHKLDRAVIYNRCDGGTASRIRNFNLLLSDDGKRWRVAYKHDGSVFGGVGYLKPLVIRLGGNAARFVRFQLLGTGYLHLDEIEVYPTEAPQKNIALGKRADQSSVSQWSVAHGRVVVSKGQAFPFAVVAERGRRLAADLLAAGVPVEALARKLEALAERAERLPKDASPEAARELYLELRWTVRRIALSNPLLDFERLFFTKRVPASYSHMSDQYYGWWSRPGGGLFILEDFRSDKPRIRDITPPFPEGSFLRPDLSYDGKRVLFAWCRYYPHVSRIRNKVDKKAVPEDAFYHIFEMDLATGKVRQLTRGRYDDFDARYLPDGRIVFLSTRRGQFLQCGRASAQATLENPFLPNSYVRCGGGNSRPVAIYTLHVMNPDGSGMRTISPFENFEWTPSVAHDGRIIYARWDYVDRHNMPFMSLWAVHPDGSFPNLVYGNFTRSPHCIFEARAIPGSRRLMFTASGHHAITAGSICLLDPAVGTDFEPPLTRLTPEVCFPEIEGWPSTYYAHPWPLSERYYLVSWSPVGIRRQGQLNTTNCLGIYLADAFGNLELLYRDPKISSAYPMPLRPRPRPHTLPELEREDETDEGRFLLLDVYQGLRGIPRGAVKRLRIVAVPAKTQPQMNHPNLGATRDDPGKLVLGSVPVEPDGSAYFSVPAGVIVFFQALDAEGMAVQTMRTVTTAQAGVTTSCVGCHEPRSMAAPNRLVAALGRPLRPPGPACPRPPLRPLPQPEGQAGGRPQTEPDCGEVLRCPHPLRAAQPLRPRPRALRRRRLHSGGLRCQGQPGHRHPPQRSPRSETTAGGFPATGHLDGHLRSAAGSLQPRAGAAAGRTAAAVGAVARRARSADRRTIAP